MPTADEQRQLRLIARELEGTVESAVKRVVFDVEANLIETTPVDTGFARASWVPSRTEPFEGQIGPSGEADSTAQRRGERRVLSYKLRHGAAFVSNNAPYIVLLNQGHSRQAAPGFVQRAIAKAVREAEGDL